MNDCTFFQDALDSVFRDTEITVGREKLISSDASFVFSNSSTSIPTLALIAISKMVSPSHCQESVSQFSAYKSYLQEKASDGSSEAKSLLKDGFVGFNSNRFGRRSALASKLLKHLPLLQEFMTYNVDEFQNKLSLANSIYLNNDWVLLCCKVMVKFDQLLVTPLLKALGVDKFKLSRSEYRSWAGLKQFFSEKLAVLKELSSFPANNASAEDLLVSKCASKIKLSLERQLDYVQFYKDSEMSDSDRRKIELCPLTNSNCEGEFAQLDNDIRRVGGTVSIQTLSNRHIVDSNKLFSSEKWKKLSPAEQRQKFHWSRSSDQSKKVRKMGKDYLEKVKAAEKIALKMKAEAKQKKLRRSLKLLETVKLHGGPITEQELDSLDSLTVKQLLSEIGYLRATIAPDIKQKRKLSNGKFETFPTNELKNQIKNAIKPEKSEEIDVNILVKKALSEKNLDKNANVTSEDNMIEQAKEISETETVQIKEGTVAVFINEKSLGEEFLGALISDCSVQPYIPRGIGFIPDGFPVLVSDLKLVKLFSPPQFSYVVMGQEIFLKID